MNKVYDIDRLADSMLDHRVTVNGLTACRNDPHGKHYLINDRGVDWANLYSREDAKTMLVEVLTYYEKVKRNG